MARAKRIYISISSGNRTEWSPIRSVIIRVITKSDDREVLLPIEHKNYKFREKWNRKVVKEREHCKAFAPSTGN